MNESAEKRQIITINKEPMQTRRKQPKQRVIYLKYLEIHIINSRDLKEEVKPQTNRAAIVYE